MGKLISIVIPCYRVEAYIDRCISSLINQTIGVENLELIFVDDASDDRTWDHLIAWESKYPESIIIIQHEKNHKQGAARNTGLQYASAPYIGFVDSDDWVEPAMYEKLYSKAMEYHTDIVGCCSRRVFGSYEKLGRTGREDKLYRYDTDEEKRLLMVNGLPGGVWSKLYRREIIFDYDAWFPEEMSYEDNFWQEQIKLHIDSFYLIEEELYHYFVNYNSTILCKSSEKHLDRLKIELMNLDAYRKLGVDKIYSNEIEYKFLRLYYINTLHIMFSFCEDFKVETLQQMQATVLSQFPDYKNNPYLKYLSKVELLLLSTVEQEYTQELLEQLSHNYKTRYCQR